MSDMNSGDASRLNNSKKGTPPNYDCYMIWKEALYRYIPYFTRVLQFLPISTSVRPPDGCLVVSIKKIEHDRYLYSSLSNFDYLILPLQFVRGYATLGQSLEPFPC